MGFFSLAQIIFIIIFVVLDFLIIVRQNPKFNSRIDYLMTKLFKIRVKEYNKIKN